MKIAKHVTSLLSAGMLLSMLSGCAMFSSSQASTINTDNVVSLENLSRSNAPASSIGGNQIRLRALKEAALTLGAQSGLAWRAQEINATLLAQAQDLRTVFNFNALILDHSVLPPVLVQASNTLQLTDPTTIRTASQAYTIESNARFVTAPPTWRDYLFMDYNKPPIPDQTLLPQNAAEQALWQHYIQDGWVSGVRQADTIYAENLARLRRDFEGMVLYRKLLAEHMVTPPFVATTDLGVTGDQNHLNVGDRVLRISALSGLQTDSTQWKPILDTRNE